MTSFQTPICTFTAVTDANPGALIFEQRISTNNPTLDDWVYIRNDFELSKRCQSNGILKPIFLGQEEEGIYIKKEHFDGVPLPIFLKDQPLQVSEFLILAIKLTKLLQDIHKDRIILKEFTVENLLIDPATKDLKYCSLGAASQLEREIIDLDSPISYRGSLWHISPEQTGRLSRGLDHRSDFYSLGVLFYELLTGQKPFEFDDTIDLIHAHIAKTPTPPNKIDENIPECLANIVMKLMAKNPENRYQGENGIIKDLEKCWKNWKSTGKIPDFHLGVEDSASTLYISEVLYGRPKEFEDLLDAWKKTKDQKASFYLVSGYSGIGKTRLINEIRGPVVESNGLFLSGKSDQLNKDVPYSGFTQIFSRLTQEILSEPEERIAKWRQTIRESTVDGISFLSELIPNIELLTEQPIEIYDIGPIEGRKKFNKAILDFLRIFEVLDRPIVLFHDDLQWADLDSLDLIKMIVQSDLRNILVIGAYRDNEVNSTHPLQKMIDTLGQEYSDSLYKISLQGLSLEDVNQFIADSFRVSPLTTKELTQRIVKKTGGNPFFIKQLLQELINEGVISYDYDLNGWFWDLNSIDELKVSDSVVDILLKRMKTLEEGAQNVLKYASCIGNIFAVDTLTQITYTSREQLSEDLSKLISEQYINPIGYWKKHHINPHEDELNQDHKFRFQHDRIQQAGYALIPKSEQQKEHYRIGKLLLERLQRNASDVNLFDVLNHFMIGREQIVTEEEKNKLAKLANEAGKKAYKNNIIRQAANYYQFGLDLLAEDQTSDHFKELLIGRSECEYLLGNYDSSEKLFDEAIKNAGSQIEKAEFLCRKMALYENTQRHAKAIDAAREGLKCLGIDLPDPVTQDDVVKELTTVQDLLKDKTTQELFNNKPMTAPEIQVAMKILMNLFGPAYLLADQQLLGFKILRMVHYSILHGNSYESALAYSLYGYVISAQMQLYQSGCEFAEIGMQLNRQFDDKTLRAKVFVIGAGCVAFWGADYNTQLAPLEEAFHSGINHNDIIWAGYATTHMTRALIMSGEKLSDTYSKLKGYLQFAQKVNAAISQQQVLTWMRYVGDMLNRDHDPELFGSQKHFDDHLSSCIKMNDEQGLALPLANFYTAQCLYSYILNDIHSSYKYAHLADPHMISVAGLMEWPEQKVLKLLSQAALLKSNVGLSKEELDTIGKDREILSKWAAASPKNFLFKKHLIDAEFYSLEGDVEKAKELYQKAIASSDIRHFKGIACERLAELYVNQKEGKKAHSYYNLALLEFHNYGALKKVEELKVKISRSSATEDNLTHQFPSNDYNLDLESLLLAAQSLSGEVKIDGLMDKLFRILIQNAGAQNAYLIRRLDNEMMAQYASVMAEDNQIKKLNTRIDKITDLPSSIIRRAYLTRTPRIINNVKETSEEVSELRKLKAESLLCLPIVSQGQTKAVIYLDNHLSKYVFDPDKIQLLNLLSGQIAISLDNTELYEDLESRVIQRTQIIEEQKLELEKTHKQSEDLLLNILPAQVAEELKNRGKYAPKRFESVSIMFTDFEAFTKMSQELPSADIVKFLDFHFKKFDDIVEKYSLEKIKTIGDSYMCVGGMPVENEDHAIRTVFAALEMSHFVDSVVEKRKNTGLPYSRIRIGIHSGTVIAGVVGYKKFAYDIWGDSVNVASRMESSCEPGRVNVSLSTYNMIKTTFDCQSRGKVIAKNKGEVDMYYVNKKK